MRIYSPLVYRYLRGQGLQDADAADVSQEVLATVCRAIRGLEYDTERGSFRGWMKTVRATRLINWRAKHKTQPEGSGDTAVWKLLEGQSAPDDDDRWEREYRRSVLDWAAEQIRGEFQDSTWQAFWQTHACGKPSAEVAQALGISVGAVYIARSRVLARLRQEIRQIDEEDHRDGSFELS